MFKLFFCEYWIQELVFEPRLFVCKLAAFHVDVFIDYLSIAGLVKSTSTLSSCLNVIFPQLTLWSCSMWQMAMIPSSELSELRSHSTLLEEKDVEIARLEKLESNLKETIHQLREGKVWLHIWLWNIRLLNISFVWNFLIPEKKFCFEKNMYTSLYLYNSLFAL